MEENCRQLRINFHTCKLCPFRTRSTYIINQHLDLHQTRSKDDLFTCNSNRPHPYLCEFMDHQTDSKVDLKHHSNLVHEETEVNSDINQHQCHLCNFTTFSQLVLMQHVCRSKSQLEGIVLERVVEKQGEWFEYNYCSYTSKYKSTFKQEVFRPTEYQEKMQNYITNKSEIKRFHCKQCSFESKYMHDLKRHVVRFQHVDKKDAINRYECDHCQFKTNLGRYLDDHLFKEHKNLVFIQCQDCSFKTHRKYDMKKHVWSKHRSGPAIKWMQCQQYLFKTKRKRCKKRHIKNKRINRDRWYQCEQCPYKSRGERAYKMHLVQDHKLGEETDKILNCGHCAFVTKILSNLVKHVFAKHSH